VASILAGHLASWRTACRRPNRGSARGRL